MSRDKDSKFRIKVLSTLRVAYLSMNFFQTFDLLGVTVSHWDNRVNVDVFTLQQLCSRSFNHDAKIDSHAIRVYE